MSSFLLVVWKVKVRLTLGTVYVYPYPPGTLCVVYGAHVRMIDSDISKTK
jgi:hypothetical protein